MDIPTELRTLVAFLDRVGLTRMEWHYSPVHFGNQSIVYRNGVVVTLIEERSNWCIVVSDPQRPRNWYDLALVREALGGSGPDVLTLQEEADFLMGEWDTVRGLFAPSRAPESHRQLERLREDRAQRWRADAERWRSERSQ